MKAEMSSGFMQADLSLNFDHHQRGNRLGLKDLQVASAEFIGTFFLVLIIGSTKVISTDPIMVPMAIGFGLVAIVYMTGPISGGQVNPAVTLGLLMRNKLSIFEALYCIAAQLCGAVAAGLVCWAQYEDNWDNVAYPSVKLSNRRPEAFFGEFLQTFALVTVVLQTATTKAQANNSYFGMAIGLSVLSGALVLGTISGACFNPAVAVLTILHNKVDDLWVLIIGPCAGGIIAGCVFRVTNPTEWDDSDPIARLTNSHHNPDGNATRTVAMLTQEFIGTFFLTWVVALSVNVPQSVGCLAIGAMLTSMVYAGGSVSGGHYNPCVTLGVYLRGLSEKPQMMRAVDAAGYVLVQVGGAFCAGLCASCVNVGMSNILSPAPDKSHSAGQWLGAEFLFSFGLVLTVLSVATLQKVSGNSYFGVAIGFFVLAAAVSMGDISGAVFNPAIALALPTLTGRNADTIWVYVVGDLMGGIAAALLFSFWHINFDAPTEGHHEYPTDFRLLGSSILDDYEGKI